LGCVFTYVGASAAAGSNMQTGGLAGTGVNAGLCS
jgi:hypothetical protein